MYALFRQPLPSVSNTTGGFGRERCSSNARLTQTQFQHRVHLSKRRGDCSMFSGTRTVTNLPPRASTGPRLRGIQSRRTRPTTPSARFRGRPMSSSGCPGGGLSTPPGSSPCARNSNRSFWIHCGPETLKKHFSGLLPLRLRVHRFERSLAPYANQETFQTK